MKTFHSAAAQQLPTFARVKTYASFRVWRDSARAEVPFAPLTKKQAVDIFHDARRFERQTAHRRTDAFGRMHLQGKVTRMGLLVLHSLLFDFLNYKSGRLDPSYQAIAAKACISVRSVARALVQLKACKILNWVRRCAVVQDGERFTLEQETNAYGVTPSTQWQGFVQLPPAPPPDPASWGKSPPLPSGLGLAADAMRAGVKGGTVGRLESDPGDLLAIAAARLGRRLGLS